MRQLMLQRMSKCGTADPTSQYRPRNS